MGGIASALGDTVKGVTSLVTGPDLSPIKDAAQQQIRGIDGAIAELRRQFSLDQDIRDADIARFALEQGIFNDQQLEELEFRRDLQDERFQVEDIERARFQAKEAGRFGDFESRLEATSRPLARIQRRGSGAFDEFREGGTVRGLDADISEILGSGNFGDLLDTRRREQQAQLSAGGLTRSGTALEAAADLPTDLAFAIQRQLQGDRSGAAGFGLQAAGQRTAANRFIQPAFIGPTQAANAGGSGRQFGFQGRLGGGDVAASIANLRADRGGAQASGTLGRLQAEGARLGNIGSFLFDAGDLAGQFGGGGFGQTPPVGGTQQTIFDQGDTGQGGSAAGFGGLASAAASFFGSSDPRLKENIERISTVGDLTIYQWDWIEETQGTIVEGQPTIGFLANEVEELYPQHIGEFGGFKVINYSSLLHDLEVKFGERAAA